MEETYWKQFMATGKIDDYLHFKGVSGIEEKVQDNKETDKIQKENAGRRQREMKRETLR